MSITIKEVLESQPIDVSNILVRISLIPNLNHQENVKTLLVIYAQQDMLGVSEKALVLKNANKFVMDFYKELELYVITNDSH